MSYFRRDENLEKIKKIDKLYLTKKNQILMMGDRGFDVDEELEYLGDKKAFIERYSEYKTYNDIRIDQDMLYGDEILVKYIRTGKTSSVSVIEIRNTIANDERVFNYKTIIISELPFGPAK